MNTTTNTIIAVVVIVILAAIYYFYQYGYDNSLTQLATTTGTEVASGTSAIGDAITGATGMGSSSAQTVTVHYTSRGFQPATVTINRGDTVDFVADQGSGSMWVASDPHPTHQGFDGTTLSQHCVQGYAGPVPFDQCASGSTYAFTFDKAGTWGYHNHRDEGMTGTVVVQ